MSIRNIPQSILGSTDRRLSFSSIFVRKSSDSKFEGVADVKHNGLKRVFTQWTETRNLPNKGNLATFLLERLQSYLLTDFLYIQLQANCVSLNMKAAKFG